MKDLSDRLFDAYNRHDTPAVARLYHADATHEDVAQGRPRRGPEAIAGGLRKFLDCFPDAQWEPYVHFADQHNGRAITYRLSATLQKPMGSLAARGQRISLRGVLVLELSDDLICRSTDYWDGVTLQRQLNAISTEETK
jgi:steroid delta-isomerase-like uncharacterized protein